MSPLDKSNKKYFICWPSYLRVQFFNCNLTGEIPINCGARIISEQVVYDSFNWSDLIGPYVRNRSDLGGSDAQIGKETPEVIGIQRKRFDHWDYPRKKIGRNRGFGRFFLIAGVRPVMRILNTGRNRGIRRFLRDK
jgi:hypothetical protein